MSYLLFIEINILSFWGSNWFLYYYIFILKNKVILLYIPSKKKQKKKLKKIIDFKSLKFFQKEKKIFTKH